VIAAYARRMEHPGRAVRLAAARAWCAWGDAMLSLEPNAQPDVHGGQPDDDTPARALLRAIEQNPETMRRLLQSAA